MKINRNLSSIFAALLIAATPVVTLSSCSSDDNNPAVENIAVHFSNVLPEDVTEAELTECILNMTELNSGTKYTFNLLDSNLAPQVPMGVYNYEGNARLKTTAANGEVIEKTLRTSGNSVSVTAERTLSLDWFFTNPGGSLVFSEIYAAGSPNATGTSGIFDTYFRIYNNSEETIYADGIAICESAFINARNSTYEILTEANNREKNFTAGTVWVIPGNGTEHPILPGQSIKIVDQAIDWSTSVPGALNHLDADFEWYDDHAMDTDNQNVPNLEKWYSYSATIWIVSNQCNRSYALVRFPEGMTSDTYLAQYRGAYEYISTTGTHMTNDKAYLIPNEWILDGVNLGNDETYVIGALGKSIDISYASISEVNSDKNRFGKKFARKVATVLPSGQKMLMDTNDSAADFERLSAK